MSDKEAKLAAARKRAEALKAKKAEKKAQTVSTDEGLDPNDEASASTPAVDTEEATQEDPTSTNQDDSSEAIDSLQKLLDENNVQRESLQSDLKEADVRYKSLEKDLKAQLADLEASLSRRDEQVQALELEISRSNQQVETQEVALKALKKVEEHYVKDKATWREENHASVQSESKKLQEQLGTALSAKDKLESELAQKVLDLIQAREENDSLRKKTSEIESTQSMTIDANQSRAHELQSKTDALQSENQSLLSQLTELQNHLISIQDEKFALAETVERLQKQLKDSKSVKMPYRSSRENSRPRASRDFDRTISSLQEVSLEDPAARNPKEPPPELQNNIRIDLTSWYDRHAGEVIEV